MAHNDSYLDGMKFGNGDTQVNIPFHDDEALHDEDNVVKTNHITDNAVTKSKIANGAVDGEKIEDGSITEDHLSEELKESWDSRFQTRDVQVNGLMTGGFSDSVIANAYLTLPYIDGYDAVFCWGVGISFSGPAVSLSAPITIHADRHAYTRFISTGINKTTINGTVRCLYKKS